MRRCRAGLRERRISELKKLASWASSAILATVKWVLVPAAAPSSVPVDVAWEAVAGASLALPPTTAGRASGSCSMQAGPHRSVRGAAI